MATKLSDAKPAAAKPAKKPASPAKPKAAAANTAPANTSPEVKPVAEASAAAALVVKPASQALKLKELVERVAKTSGAKKNGLKEIVEAVLAEMGQALGEGKELNLPPLGKAKVNRQKGDLLVLKLKRSGAEKSGKKDVTEGVAEAED
ncbi:MAG: HU family DNA-binding protein [Gemmobacter sp.]|uniref:HU family DNA-binding protein n=1 Tax=Gemmobacter sp. TaxID=1898957 RepID=UPI001A394E17|nr:HU family DNA-binding protein [Gemmobacter sp.]MBL8562272.1 HU family DNA-binding protein [Gemmobacter sp.]